MTGHHNLDIFWQCQTGHQIVPGLANYGSFNNFATGPLNGVSMLSRLHFIARPAAVNFADLIMQELLSESDGNVVEERHGSWVKEHVWAELAQHSQSQHTND